jgi:hypothetical protein
MNEQHPTETSLSNAVDSFAEASHGYPEGVQSEEMLTPQERVADFSSPSMPNPSFLSAEPQDLAHMEFPPLAQPLTASAHGSLGSFTQDSWDEGSTTNFGILSTEMNDPASLLPLQSFAAPDPIEAAQRLSTPFSLPSLPNVSFPSGNSQFAAPQQFETNSAAFAASEEQGSSAGLTASGWEPQTPAVAAFPSLSAWPQSPESGLATGREESAAPAFPSKQSALNVAPLPNASFPMAPAFPSSPMAFETPAFPAAPSFPTSFPTSFTPDPEPETTLQSFAAPEPFDAGDSFGPLDAGETNPYQQVANTAEVNPLPSEQFPSPIDFSSNPLPLPEALVVKAVDAPVKTSRFGRKKPTATDLLSAAKAPAESLGAAVAGAALSPAKKAKRFGRKPAETVDLLGAPLGARTLEPSDSAAAPSLLSPLSPSSLTTPSPSSFAAEETAESKPKRKLFATVDRSKEKPLTPNSGRGRKIVQGLAALSLLAGAGLFTMSFLDKKSPAPTPVAPVVETTLAQAPPNPLAPAPGLVDPSTGLPVPGTPVSPDATQPSVGEPSTADSLGVSPDSIPTATPIDGAPVDTTPATDGQTPVSTITPGPDDLEFSTGGNFSE